MMWEHADAVPQVTQVRVVLLVGEQLDNPMEARGADEYGGQLAPSLLPPPLPCAPLNAELEPGL